MRLVTIMSFRGDSYQHAWKLPKDVASTVESKFSAQFEHGTSDTLRGFTFEEEKRFLPDVLGVSPTDPHWREATKDYWCNMVTIVPPAGLLLNIDVREDGTPENLADYIKYRFAIKHSEVAANKNLIDGSKHRFYISDPEEHKREEKENFELRNRANKAFLFLQSPENKDKREWVAYCLRDEAEMIPTDESGLLLFLESKKDAKDDEGKSSGLKKFVDVINDKKLEHRALLFKLESAGIVIKNGNSYFFGSAILGVMDEAIEWLKNPVNNKELFQMMEKLKAETV